MDNPKQAKSPGEIAFERYSDAVGGVDYSGQPLRGFAALSDKAKSGWEAAAPLPLELANINPQFRRSLTSSRSIASELAELDASLPDELPPYVIKLIRIAYREHANYPGDRADIRMYLIGKLAHALRIEVDE